MRSRSILVVFSAPFLLFAPFTLAVACSDGDAATNATPGTAGAGGVAGKAGAAGAIAGAAGSSAGTGGASAGGAAGVGAGAGGTTIGGNAGTGAGGSPLGAACKADGDCAAVTGSTPTGCAEAFCDANVCKARSRDADGDGVRTKTCALAGSSPITLGTDCNDADPKISPNAWDGPADGTKPNACGDGIDQDCSGAADDGKTASGTSCTCTPGDLRDCSENDKGQPIVWPSLGADGKPVGICKRGSQTCLTNGTFGPCTGAVVPKVEECNTLDDDCDGQTDEGPPSDAIEWVYDGDDDKYASAQVAPVLACASAVPSTAAPWTTACPSCLPMRWVKATSIDKQDCDDTAPAIHPGANDVCGDDVDSDCDGSKTDGCACTGPEACETETNGCPGMAACTAGKVGPCVPTGACECKNGAQKDCNLASNDCAGTLTCANNVFGACVKKGTCEPGETTPCTVSNDFPGNRTCEVKTCVPGKCALENAVTAKGVAACTTLPKAPPESGTCDRHAFKTHLLPGVYKLDLTVMHNPNGSPWAFEKTLFITRADGSIADQRPIVSGLLSADTLTYEAHPEIQIADDLPGVFVGYGTCGTCVVDGYYVEMDLKCISGRCAAGALY